MPIFTPAAKVVLDSVNKCPKCGNQQVVPPSRQKEIVKCKTCGAEMPPKR